ncbi:LysM peptidoglycan-binding domain-containing protein [Thalassococcus profundi]|uniref:LysM peptidoglycan-binding domain-containing protein n=1 Tax=Thalassococcus profundi TaxID=2282382 RepID=A0A369TP97_9RHOB|nr:M23 family metallopeptidase [Thalassococcus profundi]RDD66672.1 LysM peptidoglycan-binding domain-containing protein [Thalassococcus profundi]
MTEFPRTGAFRGLRPLCAAVSLLALAACDGSPLDFDMRGRMGGSVDTSQAALNATSPRPQPDDRGVLSYPNYQVAVARRGDTLASLAARVGLPAGELATFNGIRPEDPLRGGEVIALPRRVSETTGVIRPAAEVDITTLASNAIDRAPATPGSRSTAASSGAGVEPVRHQVARGETAFTIARLYNVTPRALAEWNGLGSDFAVREGQYLLIPVASAGASASSSSSAGAGTANVETARLEPAPVASPAPVTAPGAGSPTPQPPSASKPLPAEETVAAATPQPAVPKPDIGRQTAATTSSGAMSYPVQGSIIREYAKGRNDGIDIAAPAGTPVKAAASGQVAAITSNADKVPIVVIKHPDNLLTVYTHLDGLTVKKGDAVSRGQSIGKVRSGDPARIHFEVRDGFDSVDPMGYLR